MVFTGTYEHSIDKKNRLAIPAEIRSGIQRSLGDAKSESISLYVTLGQSISGGGVGALSLYTEESFELRAQELDASQLDAEDLLAYERLFFALARRVELDKQGRVLLPEALLKRAGLGSDVVLLGVKDHLEIHNRQVWQDHVEGMLNNKSHILMNPRQAMRPSKG